MIVQSSAAKAREFIDQRQAIIAKARRKGLGVSGYFPQIIGLGLTDMCNKACNYCYIEQKSAEGQKMDMVTIFKSLEQASDANIGAAVLTGGEPTQQLDGLLYAARVAGDKMGALAIQTNTVMADEVRWQLFSRLYDYTSWGQSGGTLQFNLSFSPQRSEAETESLKSFLGEFAAAPIGKRALIEVLLDRSIEEAEGKLAELENHIIKVLLPTLKANNKIVGMDSYWPLMVGRAKALRGTSLGALIREKKGPVSLFSYRRLEQVEQDIIAVDPSGFVFPSGIYMYMGLYPIGNVNGLSGRSLREIISETNHDPLLCLIETGRAGDLFSLAAKRYPEFSELLNTCADPFEVFVDIFTDTEKTLVLMEQAANLLAKKG